VYYLHVCVCVSSCVRVKGGWREDLVQQKSSRGGGCCSNPDVPYGRLGRCMQSVGCCVHGTDTYLPVGHIQLPVCCYSQVVLQHMGCVVGTDWTLSLRLAGGSVWFIYLKHYVNMRVWMWVGGRQAGATSLLQCWKIDCAAALKGRRACHSSMVYALVQLVYISACVQRASGCIHSRSKVQHAGPCHVTLCGAMASVGAWGCARSGPTPTLFASESIRAQHRCCGSPLVVVGRALVTRTCLELSLSLGWTMIPLCDKASSLWMAVMHTHQP
jgi:hypothetical protein